MKSMNSIIFEGVIQSALSSDGGGKEQRCSFVLCGYHRVAQEGEDDFVVLDDDIRVEFRSAELVEAAWHKAVLGRVAKVAGAIHRSKADRDVYILAEHIEYSSLRKKEG
jgi:hypothetical protein